MPILLVRCVQCRRAVPTGINVTYETFKDMTYTERVLECPVCEKTQTWNLDDVDRSVFGAPNKK
jgi:endogenous inhibitor of DNA gyrase (YacG/DUF329 family)